jgi:putative transposase
MGWPRTRKKHDRRSARLATGVIRVDPGYRRVVLARLGRIRTHESTGRLARRVRAGTATILSATLTQTAGRWFCSLRVAVRGSLGRPAQAPKTGRVVGVDAGIRHLAVLSAGALVPDPAPVTTAVRRPRQGPTSGRPPDRSVRPGHPARADRVEPVAAGTGHRGTAARHRGGRAGRLRAPAHHPAGAPVRHHRGRGPAAGRDGPQPHTGPIPGRRRPGTPRRHLADKTGWYAGTRHIASRWYPSSKTCSACQTVKPTLSPAERTDDCTGCGRSPDRDVNAARNRGALVRHVDLELPGDASDIP